MAEGKNVVIHSVILMVGPTCMSIRLAYKTKEAAAGAASFTGMKLADDFGQTIILNERPHAIVLTSDEAEITAALHQSRAQAEAQKRAYQDPTLRAADQRQRFLQGNGAIVGMNG